MKKFILFLIALLSFSFLAEAQLYHGARRLRFLREIGDAGRQTTADSLLIRSTGVRIVNGVKIQSTIQFTGIVSASWTVSGKIDADYAEATAATDGTRYYDFLVTMTADPAASAEVNAGYFRINKTGGSNGVYTLNGIEGVAGSSYADEAGTFRGGYFRTYTNADATSTMRTAIGMESSARASYNGGTAAVAESGTAFLSRIGGKP
jgi:hypothetical protein